MGTGHTGSLTAMGRTDYYDDPAAPQPNSLVVAGSAVIEDDDGRILLVRRADSGNWSLPGGTMELGESITQCVVREVREETGLDIQITGLVGIYTDPKHVIAYGNGEVRQQFNICFTARRAGGQLTRSLESTAIEYVAPEDLARLHLHPTQRLRIINYLDGGTTPHLG